MKKIMAKYAIGEAVEHKMYGFRGVIFDVDPEFANTDEWWEAIPEDVRPVKEQPFYHLLAVQADGSNPYVAYVSEQNLVHANPKDPIDHPAISDFFPDQDQKGRLSMDIGVMN